MLIPVVSVLWKRKVVESVKSEVNRFEGIGELSEWQPWDTGTEAIGQMKMGVMSTGGPAIFYLICKSCCTQGRLEILMSLKVLLNLSVSHCFITDDLGAPWETMVAVAVMSDCDPAYSPPPANKNRTAALTCSV